MNLDQIVDPLYFLLISGIIFAIVMLRYFLVAGIFFLLFNKSLPPDWFYRKINPGKRYQKGQFAREIGWSTLSSVIFAFAGSGTILLWYLGFTKIYLETSAWDVLYFPFSLLALMMVHETYYYWVHRWMHRPRVFRLVHKVHHQSLIPSAWTAFSFHPLESILQAIILPALLLIIPVHPLVLLSFLVLMTITSVINHLDVELYPKGFATNSIGKWWVGATHHSLHHRRFTQNFGLYFTFWDKWLETESRDYEDLFREKTSPTTPGSGSAKSGL